MKLIETINFHPGGDITLIDDSGEKRTYTSSGYCLEGAYRGDIFPVMVLAIVVADLSDQLKQLRDEIDQLKKGAA